MSAADGAAQPALVRGVHRWQLVALIFNTVVGAGILGLPSKAYAAAGTYSLVGLALAGLIAAGVALCLCELSSRYDETGGPYVYVREAYGERPAFLAGWLIYASRVLGSATHLSLLLAYSEALFPRVKEPFWNISVGLLLVAAFMGLTLRGSRQSAIANGFFGLVKLAGLATIGLLALFAIDTSSFAAAGALSPTNLSQVTLLFLFALMGFESATIVAGEIQNPRRNLPFAILVGIAAAALLYAVLTVACIALVPNLADIDRPISDLVGALFGRAGEVIAVVIAVVMLLGSLASGFFLNPRMLFALAEQPPLLRPFASIHPRWHTPYVAIIGTSLIVALLALSGDFITILSMATSARLLVFAACCAALLTLRRRDRGAKPSFTVPGGPVIPVLAALLALIVLVQGAWKELPALAAIGIVGMLLTLRTRSR